MAQTHPQGLYDPAYEHDACGVAFVADIAGRRSHDVVVKGLDALCRLDHRGARGAEPNTGDGAGFILATASPADEARAVTVLEKYALVEGAKVLGWREVPVRPDGLGATALAAM